MKKSILNLIILTFIAVNLNAFQCDGRKYCSTMSSCEEALFFLYNCPDTKMDGDNDGIPCERQHCNIEDFFFDEEDEKYKLNENN